MASNYRMNLGKWGEKFASQYLAGLGYEIIGHNYHTRFGELDVIAKNGETLVFVEVKTRSNKEYGTGEQAITPKKIKALQESILVYLERFPASAPDWQLDLIVVEGTLGCSCPNLIHYENLGETEA